MNRSSFIYIDMSPNPARRDSPPPPYNPIYSPGINAKNGRNSSVIQTQPTSTVAHQAASQFGSGVIHTNQPISETGVVGLEYKIQGVNYKLQRREWMSGYMDCCNDMSTCCSVLWCFPCMACSMSSRMGESALVPICCPGGLAALRLKMRTENNIEGSLCNDYIATGCCGPCVLCQMKREKDALAKVEYSVALI